MFVYIYIYVVYVLIVTRLSAIFNIWLFQHFRSLSHLIFTFVCHTTTICSTDISSIYLCGKTISFLWQCHHEHRHTLHVVGLFWSCWAFKSILIVLFCSNMHEHHVQASVRQGNIYFKIIRTNIELTQISLSCKSCRCKFQNFWNSNK